jgi:flagellar biosynthesis/type III secretory pathway chaperone
MRRNNVGASMSEVPSTVFQPSSLNPQGFDKFDKKQKNESITPNTEKKLPAVSQEDASKKYAGPTASKPTTAKEAWVAENLAGDREYMRKLKSINRSHGAGSEMAQAILAQRTAHWENYWDNVLHQDQKATYANDAVGKGKLDKSQSVNTSRLDAFRAEQNPNTYKAPGEASAADRQYSKNNVTAPIGGTPQKQSQEGVTKQPSGLASGNSGNMESPSDSGMADGSSMAGDDSMNYQGPGVSPVASQQPTITKRGEAAPDSAASTSPSPASPAPLTGSLGAGRDATAPMMEAGKNATSPIMEAGKNATASLMEAGGNVAGAITPKLPIAQAEPFRGASPQSQKDGASPQQPLLERVASSVLGGIQGAGKAITDPIMNAGKRVADKVIPNTQAQQYAGPEPSKQPENNLKKKNQSTAQAGTPEQPLI